MRLQDVELAIDENEVPETLRAVFERVRRVFRAVRESLVEVEGRARVIRHNVPPTTPATPAALPTASIQYLGTFMHLDKNGAADDTVHICIRDSVGAYVWRQVTLV